MKKCFMFLFIAQYLFFFLSCSREDNPKIETEYFCFDFSQKLLGAHRGMNGFPENTILSIDKAIQAGYKIIEVDVCITKDNKVIVHHDATIDRCSNGSGLVRDFTYDELRKFDFGGGGYHCVVPSLEEILQLCKKNKVGVELDLSNRKIIRLEDIPLIYSIVNKCNALGMVIFCGSVDYLKELSKIDRELVVSCVSYGLTNYVYPTDKHVITEYYDIKSLFRETYADIHYPWITKEQVSEYKSHGIKVNAYIVNDEGTARDLYELGCDYILTENIQPPSLSEILEEN